MTLTFVVESMAAANAILRHRRAKQLQKKDTLGHQSDANNDDSDSSSSSPPTPTKALVSIVSFSYRFAKLNSRLANSKCYCMVPSCLVLSSAAGACQCAQETSVSASRESKLLLFSYYTARRWPR